MRQPPYRPRARRVLIRALAALIVTAVLPIATPGLAGMSARDIMDKVTQTRKLTGSEAVVSMSIINPKGQTRERRLSMATKLYDAGKTEKRIYRFLSPPDVEGTGVLVFDYEAAADDVWVYLPALRKTRRIVSSQRSESFMGSEFSYADLNVPPLDDYDYQLEREESFAGESCWVIGVVPKARETGQSEGYSRKTYWVSQEKFVVLKAAYLDLEGRPLKELENHDFKLLDPKQKRYRPLRMVMTNTQNGRRSVFTSEQVAFAPDTKDDYFTPRYLEKP